jgi:hypothetical protein
MDYYIEAGARDKRLIKTLLPSMVAQLKLANSRYLLYIKVDKDEEHAGQTVPLFGVDTILVVLRATRDKVDMGITLAHELTHVAQFAKGILKLTPKGKKWRGKFYSQNVAYLQQPWELQAFARQEIIFRRAIND